MTIVQTTYGPDGVTLVETIDDNGDGTGVRTVYDAAGNVTSTQPVVVPVEPEPTPDPYVVYAEALAVARTMEEMRAAATAFLDATGGGS